LENNKTGEKEEKERESKDNPPLGVLNIKRKP
jgi:hypothetical protein